MAVGVTTADSAYDEIAEWYDDSVNASSLIHDLVLPALFELIGNVEGLQVCDLACGQGVVARHLAKSGAAVVGVDTSARLLVIAQRYEAEEPLGIVYQHDDAQALATLPDTAFDGVACNTALMDIPEGAHQHAQADQAQYLRACHAGFTLAADSTCSVSTLPPRHDGRARKQR